MPKSIHEVPIGAQNDVVEGVDLGRKSAREFSKLAQRIFGESLRRGCLMARPREVAESVRDNSVSILCGVLIAHCGDG